MPYDAVENHPECPTDEPWGVEKTDGELMGCHASEDEANSQIAALNIAESEEERERPRGMMRELRELWGQFIARAAEVFGLTERGIKDVSEWDGAASRWPDTAAYCSACLIDVNSAAGREEKAQSHCMLPVREPGDGSDTFVRQAIHAAAGGRGISRVQKPDDVPDGAWESARKGAANTIISAYNEMDEVAPDSVYEIAGKEPPERAVSMPQIWEQLMAADSPTGEMGWPMDIFTDGEQLYAVMNSDGRLYRVSLSINGDMVQPGEWEPITVQHVPAAESRCIVRQQADGKWRWLNISATAILNRVGEIDSTTLFDNMIRRFNERQGRVPRRFFHLKADIFDLGDVDFLARDGVVLVSSGLFNETPLAQAVVRAAKDDPGGWGDSISYLPLVEPEMAEVAPNVRIPIYLDGELREISSLPESKAAGLFTTSAVQEVNRMASKAIIEALNGLDLDDETRQGLLAQVDATNRAVETEGLIHRDNEDAPAPPPTPAGAEPDTPDTAAPVIEVDESVIRAAAEAVVSSPTMTDLVALVAQLEERLTKLEKQAEDGARAITEVESRTAQLLVSLRARVKDLEKDEDDKRREYQADMPRRQAVRATYRPRQNRAPGNDGDQEPVSTLADTAASTLASMPSY